MDYKVIIGNSNEVFGPTGYIKPYSSELVEFCNDFSKLLFRSSNLSPELYSFAFWLRKSNVEHMIKDEKNSFKAPIGTVFHVAPRNVDTMFLYSLFIALLNGNKNVVRVSENTLKIPMIQLILGILKSLLDNSVYSNIKDLIVVVSYEHNNEISDYFSLNSDARIIWGGDNTINYFKARPTKVRIKDFYFADRISVGIYGLDHLCSLDEDQLLDFTRNFLNDVLSFDQLGCSSPSVAFFIGDNDEILKNVILNICRCISTLGTKDDYDYASFSNLKLNQYVKDILSDTIESWSFTSNLVHFCKISPNATFNLPAKSCGAGYVYYNLTSISNLAFLFENQRVQTISYFGLDKIELESLIEFASTHQGVDRIVPCGKSLNFTPKWDGYDLVKNLSREISIY